MALKITTADDPIEVKNICFTIYSQPGLGKTSLAFTASKPLLFDFDKGAYRAVDRKDVVQVQTWADVAGISAQDVAAYDTIIIDTVGKALDALAQDIIRTNARLSYGGTLNQQGWGQLGVRFAAFLKMLRGFGKDIVLIAHMDEQKDGDTIKERLKISGGSKDLVLTDSDVIARIIVQNRQRHLVFSPTETAFGKDPASIGAAELPDGASPAFGDYLAQTIASIKARLNALSEGQAAQRAEKEWFRKALEGASAPDEINALIPRAQQAGAEVKAMLARRAKDLGLIYDKKAGGFFTSAQSNAAA